MTKYIHILFGPALLLATAVSAYADISMPEVFADHMVLQRNEAVNIFGSADPGENISVSYAGQTVEATADKDGKWILQLALMKANATGRKLTINGANTITIKDVLVGEVWHANGQSNMEWALKRMGPLAKEPLTNADEMNIRFYHRVRILSPKGVYKEKQLELSKSKHIYKGGWLVGSKETAPEFSAVAYIFAQAMYQELNVPIAILSTGVGGSPTEAFISLETLMANERTAALVKDWPYSKECSTPQAKNNFKNVLKPGEKIVFGQFPYHHPWEPGVLFDRGVKPLIPYTINGAIWYQGETNQKNSDLHNLLFPMMVKDWRKNWGIGDFPVYYVQLPSVNRPTWPVFRDGQRKFVTAEPNMGIAVTLDTGDVNRKTNVHPADKIEVGNRLAYLAIQNNFKDNKVLATGPLIKTATLTGDAVQLTFDYAGGLKSSDDKPIRFFEIAAADGKYVAAQASIQDDKINTEITAVATPLSAAHEFLL